jgi:hypothetical protein
MYRQATKARENSKPKPDSAELKIRSQPVVRRFAPETKVPEDQANRTTIADSKAYVSPTSCLKIALAIHFNAKFVPQRLPFT